MSTYNDKDIAVTRTLHSRVYTKLFSPVDQNAKRNARIANFMSVAKSRVGRLLETCLVDGEMQKHQVLKDAIFDIKRDEYRRNIARHLYENGLTTITDLLLPLVMKMVTPKVVTKDQKKKVQLTFLLDHVTFRDQRDSIPNYAKAIATTLASLNIIIWTSVILTFKRSKLYPYADELASLQADIFLIRNNFDYEAVVVLQNLLNNVMTMLAQYDDIKKSERDEKIKEVKDNLLKMKTNLIKQLLKFTSRSSVYTSQLLKDANEQQKYVVREIVKNGAHDCPVPHLDFFAALNVVYQNADNVNIYLPSVFEAHITDAKIMRMMFFSFNQQFVGLTNKCIELIGFLLELGQFYFKIVGDADSYNRQLQTLGFVSAVASVTDADAQDNVTRLLILYTAVKLTKYIFDIIKAKHNFNKEKIRIFNEYNRNIYDLHKNASDGIAMVHVIPDVLSNLENAYKQFADSTAKCVEGINPVLSGAHIGALGKQISATVEYLNAKKEFVDLYENVILQYHMLDLEDSIWYKIVANK